MRVDLKASEYYLRHIIWGLGYQQREILCKVQIMLMQDRIRRSQEGWFKSVTGISVFTEPLRLQKNP